MAVRVGEEVQMMGLIGGGRELLEVERNEN